MSEPRPRPGGGGTRGGSDAESGGGLSRWLVPALTFVVGLVLGGLALWALDSDDGPQGEASQAAPTQEAETGDDASTSPSPSPSASPSSEIVVTVPTACLELSDESEEAFTVVDQAVEAVRAFDARRLEEIVDQLQQLRPRVEQAAEACRSGAADSASDVEVQTGPSATATG